MNGKSVYRQLVLLTGVVILVFFALWWTNRPKSPAPPGAVLEPLITVHVLALTATDTLLRGVVELPAGATAQSALEAAGRAAEVPVGVQEYEFGNLIVRIGSVVAGSSGHWTYRVNDSLPPVGAHAFTVQDGDRIDFHFGKTAADSL